MFNLRSVDEHCGGMLSLNYKVASFSYWIGSPKIKIWSKMSVEIMIICCCIMAFLENNYFHLFAESLFPEDCVNGGSVLIRFEFMIADFIFTYGVCRMQCHS